MTVSHQRPAPPMARASLNRAAHRRTDKEWLSQAWSGARVVVVDDGHVLVAGDDPPRLVYLPASAAPAGERFFLGVDDEETAYFAVTADVDASTVDGSRRVTLRHVGHLLPEPDGGLFITAVALANWHSRHPYSPLSGRLTTASDAGWTRVTEDGVETLWPRTDPAIIVVVHDDVPGPEGRCLLGCNAQWPTAGGVRRFSCLAGFVEPGESAEAAVAREVFEEVGVRIGETRYIASQGWPFPGSLMLGFHAVADPDQAVRVDQSEILEARWFSRAEINAGIAAGADGQPTPVALPPAASIASYLIMEWLEGRC